MANFMAIVYGTLKEKGIDTSKLSTEEAVEKFNELQKNNKISKKNEQEEKDYKELSAREYGQKYAKVDKKEFVDKLEQEGFKLDKSYSGGDTFEIKTDTGTKKITLSENGKGFMLSTNNGTYVYKDLDTAIDRAKYISGKPASEDAIGWENGSFNRKEYDEFIRKNMV